MPEYGFYHLTRTPLEMALPRLLEKVLATGKRALVRLSSDERLDSIDRALWTFDPASWLPHGSECERLAERQPILLSVVRDEDHLTNKNGATFLVVLEQAPAVDAGSFERVLELFDGNDQDAVDSARQRWVWAKSQGFDLVYWQQNERGGWQRAK